MLQNLRYCIETSKEKPKKKKKKRERIAEERSRSKRREEGHLAGSERGHGGSVGMWGRAAAGEGRRGGWCVCLCVSVCVCGQELV